MLSVGLHRWGPTVNGRVLEKEVNTMQYSLIPSSAMSLAFPISGQFLSILVHNVDSSDVLVSSPY